MLTQMRALSQNWFGRAIMAVVLGFIGLSFVVWGIGDRFTNFNANELARVGSTTITADQYRNAYRTQLQQLQQKERRGITDADAKRLGIDRQVLSRILTDAILDQQASTLGLAVGNDEIVASIVKDPAFKGPADKFDQRTFDELLRENGFTEAGYAASQRNLILRQNVSGAVIGGLDLPGVLSSDVHRFQSEVRDFDYFVLPPTAAGTAPGEAELKQYYDEHAASYVAPAYRKLVILSVTPVDLAKSEVVTPVEIETRYNETKGSRFTEPEKRTVEQLVFSDAKAADAAEAQLKAGVSFDQLVVAEKKSPTDVSLGTVTQGDIANPAVATAAFALAADATSTPIKSQFGTVILHVSSIMPGHQKALAEVSGELQSEIALERARQQAAKLRDGIEDQRSAGKTLTEAAASVGLKPRIIEAIDAAGRDMAHKPVEGLVAGPQLLKAAFQTDVGADTEMIQVNANGAVWYEVAGVDPAHQLPLAEVKAQVESSWTRDEVGRRLAAAGDTIVKAIDGGQTLTDAAAANGKPPVMRATNIGRSGGPELPPLIAEAFFNAVVGKAGSVTDGAQGRIIFKVAAAHVPPADPNNPAFAKLIDQVKTGYEDDVLAQYLARVQGEIGVKINQQVLQTALGADSGS